MKPTTHTSQQPDRLEQERRSSLRPGSNHPLIDYHFRSDADEREFGGALKHQEAEAQAVFAPGFCALSNEFFRGEAKRLYVMELLLFAIIVAISAWPIAFMIQTLALTV